MGEKNYFAYGDAETVLTEFADDIKNKVDKVSGKGLSTNDFTTAEKNKLAGIENAANKTTVDTALSSTSENPLQNKVINSALSNKVDKVSGKGLSTNDYTTTEKNKLAGIASGAEVNVQSDWSVTTSSSDAYIKNKPTSLPASDVYSWAKASTKPSYTKSEVGLGNVDNTADANKPISTATQTALNGKLPHTTITTSGIDFNTLTTTGVYHINASPGANAPTSAWGTLYVDFNIGTPYQIYIPDGTGSQIYKRAYMNNSWTGWSEINPNLSDYALKTEIPAKTSELTNDSNFVVDGNYVHTDNNYTTTEKNKLAGIASGAQVNSVTGVKGSNETSYRTGNINITKANIGLGNIDNTADSNKNVNTAQYLRQRTMTSSEDSLNDIINANDYTLICRVANTVGSVPANDSWFDVINFGDDNTRNQNQLAISSNNSGVYYRRKTGDTWFDWVTVFDTKNCVVELDTTGTSNNGGTFYNNVIKFPNGLCIQWGKHTKMPSGIGVFFKYAFSSTPSATFGYGQGYAQNGAAMLWFDDYAISNSVDWMAIGYIS